MICPNCQREILPTPQFDGTTQRVWANGKQGPEHLTCPDKDEPEARGIAPTMDEE